MAKVLVLANLMRIALELVAPTEVMVDKESHTNLIHRLHVQILLRDRTIPLVRLDLKGLEVEADYRTHLWAVMAEELCGFHLRATCQFKTP